MTYTFLKFFVYSLAIWRLTYLIARDNGPFHLCDWFRHKIGIEVHTDGHEVWKVHTNQFAEMVDCMYCLSFWVALLFMPGFLPLNPSVVFIYDMVASFLALWGVSTLLAMVSEEK